MNVLIAGAAAYAGGAIGTAIELFGAGLAGWEESRKLLEAGLNDLKSGAVI
jgi:hypothetical protein